MALWNVASDGSKAYTTIVAAFAAIAAKYNSNLPFTETEEIVIYDMGVVYSDYVKQNGINPTVSNRLKIHGATGQLPLWYMSDVSKVGCIWLIGSHIDFYNLRIKGGGYICAIYSDVGTPCSDIKIYSCIIDGFGANGKLNTGNAGSNWYIYNNLFSKATVGAGADNTYIINNTFINSTSQVQHSGNTHTFVYNNIFGGDLDFTYASIFLSSSVSYLVSDYNVFIAQGNAVAYSYTNGLYMTTLAAWQAVNNQDLHSISVSSEAAMKLGNPSLRIISSSNINSWKSVAPLATSPAFGIGMDVSAIISIITDFNGNTRDVIVAGALNRFSRDIQVTRAKQSRATV